MNYVWYNCNICIVKEKLFAISLTPFLKGREAEKKNGDSSISRVGIILKVRKGKYMHDKLIENGFINTNRYKQKKLISFHQLGPLGRVGLVVAMCVCFFVCFYVSLFDVPFSCNFLKVLSWKVFSWYLWLLIIIIHRAEPMKPQVIIINHYDLYYYYIIVNCK